MNFPEGVGNGFRILDIPHFSQERSAIPPVGSAESPLNGAFS